MGPDRLGSGVHDPRAFRRFSAEKATVVPMYSDQISVWSYGTSSPARERHPPAPGERHPEYDSLAKAFSATLDREERTRLLVDMAKLYADEFPNIPLFFRSEVYAFVAALRGPQVVPPETYMSWNIHTWEFR